MADEDWSGWAAGVVAVALLGALVVAQGGYWEGSSGVACVFCAVLAVALLVRGRLCARRGAAVVVALAVVVVLACLAGAWVNGLSYAELAALEPWLLFAAALALCVLATPDELDGALSGVGWLGVVCGVAGVCMFAGIVEYPSGIGDGNRLYFCFQYANTAGVFFLAMSLVALGSTSAHLRWAAFPSMASLALTQSGGAAAIAVAACAVLGVVWAWRGETSRIAEIVVQGVFALVVCLVGFEASGWGLPTWSVLVVAAAGMAVCIAVPFAAPRIAGTLPSFRTRAGRVRRWVLSGVVVIALAALVAVLVAAFPERVAEALGTFGRRLWQMQDALTLVAAHPLFGIGPDRWQFEYAYIQEHSYSVGRVHNGYLQLALDGGLPALLAFLAAVTVLVVCGVRRSRGGGVDGDGTGVRNGGDGAADDGAAGEGDGVGGAGAVAQGDGVRDGWLCVLVAACALLAHAVIDFDFSFGAILVLLALLLARVAQGTQDVPGAPDGQDAASAADASDAPGAPSPPDTPDVLGAPSPPDLPSPAGATFSRAAGVVVACSLVGVLVLGCVGLWANSVRSSIERTSGDGDVTAAVESVQASALGLHDEGLIATVLDDCVAEGSHKLCVELADACGGPRGEDQVVSVAVSLVAVGRSDEACELLEAEVAAEPKNKTLARRAKTMLALYGTQ